MNFFGGMMPCSEIEKSEYYEDANGKEYSIDCGPNGYSILLPANGAAYCEFEEPISTEESFKLAEERLFREYSTVDNPIKKKTKVQQTRMVMNCMKELNEETGEEVIKWKYMMSNV